MKHTLSPAVEALLRAVAAEVVMPRYQMLEQHQINEKTPGELVTIADQESEERLNAGLSRILPEAALVGEEAVSADPAILDRLNSGVAWIIDPIDGTSNFAAGRPHFGLMVGLVADGEMLAGWMYDPLRNRMCHAAKGGGAFIDDAPIIARGSGADLPIAAVSMKFMDPSAREAIMARCAGRVTFAEPPMCAAEQYPRVVLGDNDLAVFERTLPWDHVPGALFLLEAGGHIARMDGAPYRFADKGRGMLAAASRLLWDSAAKMLDG